MTDRTLVLPPHLGEEVSLEASVRYDLTDRFTVWVVEKEAGDLFLYNPQDPHYLPIFVSHLKEDMLLLSSGPTPDPQHGLFFLSPRSTILRKIPWDTLLKELGKDPHLQEIFIKLLERHLYQMFSYFPVKEEAPQKILDFGKEVDVPPGEVAGPRKSYVPEEKERLFWVEVLQGSGDLLDDSSSLFFKQLGVLYPMIQSQWLRSKGESALKAVTTREALEKKSFWGGIDTLHHELFRVLVKGKAEELENALVRLQKKQELEEDLIEHTLLTLGSVLNEEITASHLHEGNALFHACDLVGHSMGLTFKNGPVKANLLDDQVSELCWRSNIEFRRIVLKEKWWKESVQSILGFMGKEERPVAIIYVKEGYYEVIDPQQKEKQKLTPALASELSEIGYVFYKGFPPGKLSLFQVAKNAYQSNLRNFLSILFLALAIGSLNLFLPFATRELFDTILFGTDVTLFKQFVLGLILVSLSTTIFIFCKNLTVLRVDGLSKAQMQTSLWLRIIQLPLSFFRRHTAGDLAMRIMSFDKVRMEATTSLINLGVTSIYCIYYFILLFFYDAKFAAVGLLGLFAAAIAFVVCITMEIRLTKKSFALGTTLQGIVVQIISGISKIRVAGAEGRFFNLWGTIFGQKKKIDLKLLIVIAVERMIYRIFPILMTTLLFWVAIVSFRNDPSIALSLNPSQSLGTFLGFYTAYALLITSALEVFQLAFSIWSVLPYWDRSKLLVQEETETRPEHPTVALKGSTHSIQSFDNELKGEISLEHVYFRYDPEGLWALEDVSLVVHPGEMIAIVGPSGCGKSTIVRLLLGFEKAEQGNVTYDDQDIFSYDLRALRRQLGTVLQVQNMLGGSIRYIISGAKILPDEEIERAIRLAGLEEDMQDFPMGLNTVMSMGGNTVSGGQRQRLFIARAIAASPKILILDEATSALDNRAQEIVSENLQKLNITRIMIAHRLTTTRHADRIYVMDAGKIVEAGTYQELIQANGLFAAMLKRQEL